MADKFDSVARMIVNNYRLGLDAGGARFVESPENINQSSVGPENINQNSAGAETISSMGEKKYNSTAQSKSLAEMLVDQLYRTKLEGSASYSGEKDYGNGWTGNNLNAGGTVSTDIPINDYTLGLSAGGNAGRWSVTSPEEERQYGAPSRESGTYGNIGTLAASLMDAEGRNLGFEWAPGDNEKFMLRGRIPF